MDCRLHKYAMKRIFHGICTSNKSWSMSWTLDTNGTCYRKVSTVQLLVERVKARCCSTRCRQAGTWQLRCRWGYWTEGAASSWFVPPPAEKTPRVHSPPPPATPQPSPAIHLTKPSNLLFSNHLGGKGPYTMLIWWGKKKPRLVGGVAASFTSQGVLNPPRREGQCTPPPTPPSSLTPTPLTPSTPTKWPQSQQAKIDTLDFVFVSQNCSTPSAAQT